MRTFFLAIIICASLCLLKAQSVSMNMDIEWKQKNVYLFDSIGMTKVPFLRICFTNNTSDSLYFYGLKSDSLKYINLYNEDMLISYTNGSVYPDLTDYLTSYKTRESGNNFNILINKFNKTGYSDWILFKDKDDTSMKISDNKNPKISWKINTIAQMLEIQDELNLLAEIVIKHDLIVIVDDVYTNFCYSREYIPFTMNPTMRDHTILIGSFSKNYVMTGWRVGFIFTASELIHIMKEIK